MKPASRIQANIEILESLEKVRMPMDSRIGDYMRHRRYIGSKDRAEIAERAYHIMRAHARLAWWLSRLALPDTPRNGVILWLALGEQIDLKRFSALFDGTQYAPEPLTESEIQWLSALERQPLNHPDMPESVATECPVLYEAPLKEYFGETFHDEMSAMLAPATLDLRVNIFTCTREKARVSLEEDGVPTTLTPYSPWGLRCENKAFLSKTKAFQKGWVEIQDEGSQCISALCGAQPGMQVLDFCAGGGGKTLALGSAMQRKGRIVAMDNDEKRLERGRIRYRKAHLADIIEVRPLSDEKHRKWLRRQKETFDIVLTDVPCSGSGTWRRNPDLRWRPIGPSLEELTVLQAGILDKVAPCVKPEGHLVYATCSLLPAENEEQITAFLKRHDSFEIDPVPPQAGLGSPFMRLTPLRHNTDGFFAARLKKKSV